MNIFNRKKQIEEPSPVVVESDTGKLAEKALSTIHDGVIIADSGCLIRYINPEAISMTEVDTTHDITGLNCNDIMDLEDRNGQALPKDNNELIAALKTGQALEKYICVLVPRLSKKKIPIAISVTIVDDETHNRIITFRNVTKELEEEDKQAEFISTASHEMRTPVAAIDGYISLALNPQTATIDERAKGYLESASKSSKHLGRLFQDLLDVTKLDDGHVTAHPEPVEIVDTVKQIVTTHFQAAANAGLHLECGTKENVGSDASHRIEQVIYSYVDTGFLQEIVDNLVENAIKYTPSGGSVRVGVRGEEDRVIIEVSDTGIGISREDLQHIFQKFYRADNSDTRTIGGTGLGLYIVKQRAESMGGHVWAESVYGNGSSFFVSLPRLSSAEYERRKTMIQNANAMSAAMNAAGNTTAPATVISSANEPPSATTDMSPAPNSAPPVNSPSTNPNQSSNAEHSVTNLVNSFNNNPNGGTQ